MKTVITALALALTLAAAPARADVAIGKPAPDFTLPSDSGKPVTLSGSKGKLVVLEWVNKSCPFVRKQYDSGAMQALQKKYTAEGVEWLAISSSAPGKEGYFAGPAEAAAFKKQRQAAMSAVLLDPDGTVGHLYGAKTTPDMVVIAKDGTLAYEGAIDDKPSTDVADVPGRNYVAQALDALMAGKSVPVAQTRSYGCGIKYQ
jgi:peroxiredoxin